MPNRSFIGRSEALRGDSAGAAGGRGPCRELLEAPAGVWGLVRGLGAQGRRAACILHGGAAGSRE